MSPLWLPYDNKLLARLSDADLALLGPVRRVELASQVAIQAPNQPIEFVYFIERGLVSVFLEATRDEMIEVGLIGVEGMTGLAVIHGVDVSPFTTFFQGDGAAIRIEADNLQSAMARSPTLRALLMRYAQVFTVQLASTASANGTLLLVQRLARLLLMVADRTGGTFRITHEALAVVLAVRRPGITAALNHFERHGLVRTIRGAIAIADRQGLVDLADGAYGVAEEQYEQLIERFAPVNGAEGDFTARGSLRGGGSRKG